MAIEWRTEPEYSDPTSQEYIAPRLDMPTCQARASKDAAAWLQFLNERNGCISDGGGAAVVANCINLAWAFYYSSVYNCMKDNGCL